MLGRVPSVLIWLVCAGVLLIGPVSVLAFLLGGMYVGVGALLAWIFYFVTLYIIIVRQYGD
jgi:hypothetical protein